jgi:hypothetical protein
VFAVGGFQVAEGSRLGALDKRLFVVFVVVVVIRFFTVSGLSVEPSGGSVVLAIGVRGCLLLLFFNGTYFFASGFFFNSDKKFPFNLINNNEIKNIQ